MHIHMCVPLYLPRYFPSFYFWAVINIDAKQRSSSDRLRDQRPENLGPGLGGFKLLVSKNLIHFVMLFKKHFRGT